MDSKRAFWARHGRRIVAATAFAWLVVATSSTWAQSITLVTHDSFALPIDVVEAFERRTGISVRVVTGGDAGEMTNRLLLTADRPIGEVAFGVDDGLFARAGVAQLFDAYVSSNVGAIDEDLRFAGDLLTPVTVGFVNFNVDLAAFRDAGTPVPTDLTDLLEPAYHGATAVMDPATSSPGLAFMLTTVARFGEGGTFDWLDYWAGLRKADVLVTSGWSDAYYGAFTRYGGDRKVVLSYATSPAAEVMFSDTTLDAAPTANLLCDRCSWRQVEGAGILAGSDERDAAAAIVDFLTSREVQEAVPTSMFVYPVRRDVALPPAFEAHATRPTGSQVASLDPTYVAEMQATWLRQWTDVMRRGRDPSDVR